MEMYLLAGALLLLYLLSKQTKIGGSDVLNYIINYPENDVPNAEWWEMNTLIAIANLYANNPSSADAWLKQVTDKRGTDRYGTIVEGTFPPPYGGAVSNEWTFVNVYIVRAYFQFKDSGKLSSQAINNMRNVLANRAGTIPSGWSYGENHNAMAHSAAYFGNVVTGGDRTQNIAWLSGMLDGILKYGYRELNSPTYMGAEFRVLWNLYDFAVDPILKNKAKAVLDMLLAEMAVIHVQGMRGGPFYRYYGTKIVDQTDDAHYGIAHCYFDTPCEPNFYRLFPWFSTYRVPSIIKKIAKASKPPFVFKSKRYILSTAVSTYYYVTEHNVLATVQGDFPDARLESTNTGQRGHVWDLIFDTSPYKVIFSGAAVGINMYAESDAVQSANVLITSQNTQINYIGVNGVSEGGWIFVQEGKTYVAVRPLSSRILIEVRDADDYGKSFNEFKEEIKSNYLAQSGDSITYRNTYGQTIYSPTKYTIGGDSFSYDLFDCPYLKSVWGSGKIDVVYGTEIYTIRM